MTLDSLFETLIEYIIRASNPRDLLESTLMYSRRAAIIVYKNQEQNTLIPETPQLNFKCLFWIHNNSNSTPKILLIYQETNDLIDFQYYFNSDNNNH